MSPRGASLGVHVKKRDERESQSVRPTLRYQLYRHAGLGIELAAAVAGLTLAGLWTDYHFKTRPIGVLVGATLGVVGGLYNFIREALRMTRDGGGQPPAKQRRDSEDDDTER